MTSDPRIDLVYDRDCPNVARARAMIRAALQEVGVELFWWEWDRDNAATPVALRGYGSPTVLVNGRDVDCEKNDSVEADGNSCRVYFDECGCICGAPSATLITSAIRRARAA